MGGWQKKNEKINLWYDRNNKKILSIEIYNYDSIIDFKKWIIINSIVFVYIIL